MDITSNTGTGINTWDLDMSMGNQLLQHQNVHERIQPIEPFQTHMPSPSFPVAQMGTQRGLEGDHEEVEGLGAMKEMMYKIAAMQPLDIDPLAIRKPKRRNVRISDDPQSIAARHRRERISEKISVLQRLVPGGTKMDTASMLDEAIQYVKFLKRHVLELQSIPPAAATAPDWFARLDTRGSSSSAMGAPSGLRFNFGSDGAVGGW